MKTHNPLQDIEFWAPLEKTLNKSTHEVTIIALDWLYRAVCHEALKQTLYFCDPQGANLGKVASLKLHSTQEKSINPLFTPKNLDDLYRVLGQMTLLNQLETLKLATRVLRGIISHAKSGHLVVYLDENTTACQVTDSRLPFPSMQLRAPRTPLAKTTN